MNTKLTLTIDKDVVAQAKAYAKRKDRSLSNLIESFLRQVSREVNNDEKIEDAIHPDIAALRGSIKMPKDFSFDYKKELNEARDEKFKDYLK